jgi:hypothetical protein
MTAATNPRQKVEGFLTSNGELGSIVLEAFNTVDPLHCYYGVNADEYLGYAERFIASLRSQSFTLNGSPSAEVWHRFLSELVRRTFGPTQIAESFVRIEAVVAIASMIQAGVPPPHEVRLNPKPTPAWPKIR